MLQFLDTPRLLTYAPPESHQLAPRRQERVFGYLVSVLDAVVLGACFWGAYLIRNRIGIGALQPLPDYLWVIAIALPIWVGLARGMGLATSQAYRWPAQTLALTMKVHVIGAMLLLSALYLLKAVEISRLLIQTFLVVGAIGLVLERLAIHATIVRLAERWKGEARRLLVVGPAAAAEGLHRMLNQRPHWGAQVAGRIATDRGVPGAFSSVPVLGRISELEALLDAMIFDEICVADAGVERDYGDRIVALCLERGLTYHTLVRMPGHEKARHHAESLGDGLYFISLETTPQNPILLFVKRVIDIVGASVGLLICGVAVVIFAPLICMGSTGPAIFRQTRVGRNGRRFTLYKLRTMGSDAEAQKERLSAANEMRGHLFKLRNDPRVTRIGSFLRRTYLDEVPQFWNVLKGDMSLVGPRPPTPDEVACYSPHHRRRLSVRPGITGVWQTRGNGSIADFETVVQLDCDYIDQWSIWLDLKIIARTCLTVGKLAGH